jgi:hypothetical protein
MQETCRIARLIGWLAIMVGLANSEAYGETVVEPSVPQSANQSAQSLPMTDDAGARGTQIPALDCACQQCEECCEDEWPHWYVQAESLFLWRDNGTRNERLFTLTNLTTQSAQFDVGIGPQLVVGVQTAASSGWEGKYFSVLGMNGVASDHYRSPPPTLPLNLDANGDGVPDAYAGFMDFGDLSSRFGTQIEYQSALHNIELNYMRIWNRLALLGGFRYVRLNETFEERLSYLDNGVWHDVYGRHTENNLYGAQIGAQWKDDFHRLSWETTGKAGLFGNNVELSYYRHDESRGTFLDCEPAFVGDINASIVYRISSVWGLRCGYNVMWISNVALAPDQPRYEDSTALATTGSVFLHGVNVGFEGQW